MKTLRIFSFAIALFISMGMTAQSNSLTEAGNKAQKSLMEYLRVNGFAPSVDTRDNSVMFKTNNVLYWVSFEQDAPVLYTLHRKPIVFADDYEDYYPSCVRYACDSVNRVHHVKATFNAKARRVDFTLETFAKEPSDFHGGFYKMLLAFKDVDKTFTEAYDRAVKLRGPIVPPTPIGNSPLKISYIGFGNFDASGNKLSDYDQPLRKSAVRYIKASIDIEASEKGLYKVGMKLYNPDGRMMNAAKGVEYASTANVEITKKDKPMECEFRPYGSDEADFWKAGEYKVRIFDYETGSMIHETSFTIL